MTFNFDLTAVSFLFCGLYFVFGLVLLLLNRSLFFLFFSDFIWFMRKKRSNGNGENERMRGKKEATERMREKKEIRMSEKELI